MSPSQPITMPQADNHFAANVAAWAKNTSLAVERVPTPCRRKSRVSPKTRRFNREYELFLKRRRDSPRTEAQDQEIAQHMTNLLLYPIVHTAEDRLLAESWRDIFSRVWPDFTMSPPPNYFGNSGDDEDWSILPEKLRATPRIPETHTWDDSDVESVFSDSTKAEEAIPSMFEADDEIPGTFAS
ncbi:hypothetical protein DL93DRAFT_2168443 [Clavulina sp. PMI_390]|nr:hypothetical protein DL93DRAFT_2168443 [Clavulina sp. PMI_390]